MKRTALTVAILVFLSAFVVIIAILPEARATTLYVGGGGPGNYTTIQSAIDAAVPGNTIFVYNGTYNENLVVDRTLSLVGENRDSTLINGGGFGDTIHVTADWVNLTGFFVWNGGMNGWDAGIELDQVHDCSILDNNFIVNDFDGIFLRSSSNNTIANNIVIFNVDIGIYLLSSHNNTIIDNNVSSNGFNIALDSSNGNIIANNSASDSDSGIGLFYSDWNTVTGNDAFDNTNHGINLEYSHNNRVDDNRASNHWYDDIRVYYSNGNILSNNTVSKSRVGILVRESAKTTVTGNAASSNGYGIRSRDSTYGTFADNVMIETGFHIEGSGWLERWNTHSIDTSNTVNGRPVHYWKNVNGGTIPLDAGQVILANCTGVTVEGQNLSNGTTGIILGLSSGNTIINNTLSSNNMEGILLESSGNNTVSQNTVYGSGVGVNIRYTGENIITNNTVSLNGKGISLGGPGRNMVDNNTISRNRIGLHLHWSNGNVITNNSIRSNSRRGISLIGFRNSIIRNSIFSNRLGVYVSSSLPPNNTIHHNDFVDNEEAADDATMDNQWDDGYPSGGNYWSDYTGVDLFSGPNQDQPGSDGIGDTPYDRIGGNEDRYPLMSPTMTILPRPPDLLQACLSGDGLENVTIEWDLSPDDGDGLRSVVVYDIYRGSAYSPDGSGYGLVASLTNGTSSFVDNYRGEGDPNTYFYRVCAVDLSNNSACDHGQASKFTRPLAQGPNLVSIPLIQSNESIETVLQTVKYDRAWYYDSSSQEWKWYMKNKGYRRGLWSANHTMGIWVNVTEDSNLTVAGVVPAQTTIHLHEGWNLVSFPSVNTSFIVGDFKASLPVERVEGFDPAPPYFLRVLLDSDVLPAGRAYWVKVQADVVWTVSFE